MGLFQFGKKEKIKQSFSDAEGVWPRRAIVDVLEQRYAEVEDLGEHQGFALYGVTENQIRFVVVLVPANGAPDMIGEVGFLARFVGFTLTDPGRDAVNRNLHISVLEEGGEGDLLLIGGIKASGAFQAASFSLVLDAWRRDIIIALQGIEGTSAPTAFAAAQLEEVRSYASNAARIGIGPAGEGVTRALTAGDDVPTDDGPIDELARATRSASSQELPGQGGLLAAFVGGRKAVATCPNCNGRGKIGMLAKTCPSCGGKGVIISDQ